MFHTCYNIFIFCDFCVLIILRWLSTRCCFNSSIIYINLVELEKVSHIENIKSYKCLLSVL